MLPTSQLHYADPAVNDEAQRLPITPFVDRIHYPTLGCPALLQSGATLVVLVSLPEGADPTALDLSLVDRHGSTGQTPLRRLGEPTSFGAGPEGKTGRRVLHRIECGTESITPRLYDLALESDGSREVQPNAVRIYAAITGDERVVFCGDSQFNVDNAHCLARFVDRMNALDDVAWIALIGDVCDNGVKSELNILRLGAFARPGPVHSYYAEEYPRAAQELARLNKPIVLVPGNHDGMVAYENYAEGAPTTTYLGPDPLNEVAYDGLHHYRRTFGPLYFAFDWGKTRYLCTNTFELDRHQRLGYHAIVANWGGFMREEQVRWLENELRDADARGSHKVVLMHHDPRGGSLGKNLGYYKDFRPYTYKGTADIVVAYLRYLALNVITGQRWQQEWMRWPAESLSRHPARELLSLLVDARVSAVLMGHDNECWIDEYFEGDSIFRFVRPAVEYAGAPAKPVDPELVRDVADLLEGRELDEALRALEGKNAAEAEETLRKAVARLDAQNKFAPLAAYAPGEVEAWNLVAKAPLRFVHVDDVGAYEHGTEADFEAYGYVLATLHEGRPISLQRVDLSTGKSRPPIPLEDEDLL